MADSRTINLNAISSEDSFLLGKLFSSHKNIIEVFKKNMEFRIWYANKMQIIKLSHDVIHRPRNKNHNEDRYEVMDAGNIIGSGGFSKIYDVLFTMMILEDGSVACKKNKNRVVKVQTHNYDDLKILTNEIELSKKAGNLHIKNPAIIGAKKNKCFSYTVMRKLKGPDLFTHLKKINAGKEGLSTVRRLEISIQLLNALQDLHNKGIIHRDIKPENIMYDLLSNEVNIIDYGLSKLKNENDVGVIAGTTRYIAPEVFCMQGTNEKSDVYSMAKVLWLLWDLEKVSKDQENDNKKLLTRSSINRTIRLNFNEVEKIKMAIDLMSNYPQDQRISCAEAIRRFESVRDEYLKRTAAENKSKEYSHFAIFSQLKDGVKKQPCNDVVNDSDVSRKRMLK